MNNFDLMNQVTQNLANQSLYYASEECVSRTLS
jgi:hypothetical protein